VARLLIMTSSTHDCFGALTSLQSLLLDCIFEPRREGGEAHDDLVLLLASYVRYPYNYVRWASTSIHIRWRRLLSDGCCSLPR